MLFALAALAGWLLGAIIPVHAQDPADKVCYRPAEGAIVQDAPEISSRDGSLRLTLSFKSALDSEGKKRYCFVSEEGLESPTLRLSPGDHLSIHLQNDLPVTSSDGSMVETHMPHSDGGTACAGVMNESSTNLHFHGLALPPVCHQDDSIHTLVDAGQTFDYNLKIPADNPSGLYWYHPHPHRISQQQVQGGASGALIVDGIQLAVPILASLPERTFILRDQLLSRGAGAPSASIPSWDVSINYVPIKYPEYVPATIAVKPGVRQFWRFVNAAANTIFNLQVVSDGVPQPLEVYAVDGVPLSASPVIETAVYLPPGARAELVLKTPLKSQNAELITTKIDSGPTGDSAPARLIANIVSMTEPSGSGKTSRTLDTAAMTAVRSVPVRDTGLSGTKPVRTRNLYFSQNGNGTEGGSGAATKFYITVLGQPVKSYDMGASPNIVAQQGTVEDWNIQNTTPEDHIFHIHQIHFQLVAVNGVPVNDPTIRDTIRVPHQVGRTPLSSVRLRMDFRDPNIVGSFVYHCHILDHEDRGMMGSIEVLPAVSAAESVRR